MKVTKVCANGPLQSVLCTVTVTNIGTVPSVSPLSLTDVITGAPANALFTGGGGTLPISCSPGAGPVLPIACSANISLLPNQPKTALFSFKFPTGATFTNCATVTQGQNPLGTSDPNPANNTNICTTIVVPGSSGDLCPNIAGVQTAIPPGMSLNPAGQCVSTVGCCAAASLIGDTVTTQFAGGVHPIVSRLVSGAVELPAAGPTLGLAGSSPRFNIDFGANTIRIDFVNQPATYGPGSQFTFASLNPVPPAGCTGTPRINGIEVTTNRPASAFVPGGATFGPNQVIVRIAGATNVDWLPGQFVLVRLTYACDIVVAPLPGSITIVKDAQPNDAQDFAFYAFGPNSGSIMPFLLDDDAGAVGQNNILSNSKTFTLAPGSYSVKEDLFNPVPVTGWSLAGIVCTSSTGATVGTVDLSIKAFTVNLAAGDNVSCKFTNVKTPPTGTGTLTIVKVVQPLNNPQAFTFTSNVPTTIPTFQLDNNPSTSTIPNSQTFTNLPAGVPYTVTESAVSGWTVPSLQCLVAVPGSTTTFTDQLNRTFTVNLAAGANVTCTFINVKTPPTGTACAAPSQNFIGCRLTVTVKRTQGPATYTVSVSPPAPFPNILPPSTPSQCTIAGGPAIPQTTCWFNYNTNPQAVTLTASSSAGPLPAGFFWSGACSGTNPTCTPTPLNVTLLTPPSVTANFP